MLNRTAVAPIGASFGEVPRLQQGSRKDGSFLGLRV